MYARADNQVGRLNRQRGRRQVAPGARGLVLKGEDEEDRFEDSVPSATEALAVTSRELLDRLVRSPSQVDGEHMVALAVVSNESSETGLKLKPIPPSSAWHGVAKGYCVTEWFFEGKLIVAVILSLAWAAWPWQCH